jgi:hypothetical protein
MTVAAFALPIPKLTAEIPSAIAFGMGRPRPMIPAPVRSAKISR